MVISGSRLRQWSAACLLLTWSHLAASQTAEVTLNGTNGYTITVHNIDLNDSIASFTMELLGGGNFDTLSNATTTPFLGSNNDPNDSPLISVVPNTAPLTPGEMWSGSGDIDGTTTAVNATITFEDQRVESFALNDQGGNVYSTIFTDTFGPPSGSDFADMCATSTCTWYPVATVYTLTGEPVTLKWVPDSSDAYRGDRMFYYTEIRTLPLDNVVIALQTEVAETEFIWTPTLVGHYHARVQACDPELIPSGDPVDVIPSEHCSDWADSMNDANTPPEFPGWMVFVAVNPSTGGGIE